MRTKVHMDAIEATPHLLGCRVDGVSFTQVDFYDRSVLGEGIHCLKCGSFVNLPRDGDPMVQCPYCAYRWCVRCKCPWTLGGNQISSRHRRDARPLVDFYAGGTRISSVAREPTSRWRNGENSMARSAVPVVLSCVEINQYVGFAAVLAPSSGEKPAPPRRRAGVAMAWSRARREV